MTVQGGVAAYNNSWKGDTFSVSDKKIDLQIQHSFWSHTVVSETTGWIVANVRVKNTGNILLKNVVIYVDVDDSSKQFDAHICDSNGNITDTGIEAPALAFGDIAPGVTATQKSYWWIVKPRFPGSEGSTTTGVDFTLYPTFTADFKQVGEGFTSTSNLDKS